MRAIYDANSGSNVTSSVQSMLQAGSSLVTAYLYSFQFMNMWGYNPYGNFSYYVFTDAGFPITTNYLQLGPGVAQAVGYEDRPGGFAPGLTFLPEAISADKLSYGIGFEDKPVEVKWIIDDTENYNAFVATGGLLPSNPSDSLEPQNLTLKQAFCLGIFTEAPFWIHAAIFSDFPRNGGTFLGTTLMFRGFIREVTASRSMLTIGLASLLDVFQSVQVPTQVLTPNNRALPYIPAASSVYGGDFSAPVVVNPQELQFLTNEAIPANALQDSWITFQPAVFAANPIYLNGTPSAPAFRIQGNTSTPGGRATVTLYFYEPIQIPTSPTFFNVYAQLSTQGGNQGFLFLPPPEFSA